MSDSTSPSAHAPNTTNLEPLIIAPTQTHTQTIILLHGRGSTALQFGPALIARAMSPGQTLRTAFPHAKFIFPTAPLRRAVIYKRRRTHQWFDNWHLHEPAAREELQLDGLRDTCAVVHALIRAEVALVGEHNVILGGLSQGCAAALVALLTWDGEPLGAMIGMSGWLPFSKRLVDLYDSVAAEGGASGYEEDIFEGSAEVDSGGDPAMSAVTYLLEELGMEKRSTIMAFQRTPVFLGHGIEDDRVFVHLGREAAGCLKLLGTHIRWKEYGGLGHWYSEEMLHDIKCFLEERLEKAIN